MKRLLAGILVIAAVGVVIVTHNSSAASPHLAHGGVATVAVTPRLKRLLQAEISTLRKAQPRASAAPVPAPVRPLNRRAPLTPALGVGCFVAGGARCSEIPCHVFAGASAVFESSSTEIIIPGARRKLVAPSCMHRAPHRLVPVAGP